MWLSTCSWPLLGAACDITIGEGRPPMASSLNATPTSTGTFGVRGSKATYVRARPWPSLTVGPYSRRTVGSSDIALAPLARNDRRLFGTRPALGSMQAASTTAMAAATNELRNDI